MKKWSRALSTGVLKEMQTVAIHIDKRQLEFLLAEAKSSSPHECCGVLAGRTSGTEKIILAVWPTGNEAPDGDRMIRYRISPERFWTMRDRATDHGMEILGFYHSHPDAGPEPSRIDTKLAWSGSSYLILGRDGHDGFTARSWIMKRDRTGFEQEEILSTGCREFAKDLPARSTHQVSYSGTVAGGEPFTLTANEEERYGRHLIIPEIGKEGQERLKESRVLVVGAGGLGSPAALYLAAAGIGQIGLVDFDRVEESNLPRQVLYVTRDRGTAKINVAKRRLEEQNPNIHVETFSEALDADNAMTILKDYDPVLDCTDNFPSRYLLNDACGLAKKTLVHGSVGRFEGQASVFRGSTGPCYRCLYPEAPPPGAIPTPKETGVLNVLPGLIGIVQATETIKITLGIGDNLLGRLLLFDARRMKFREIAVPRDPLCPLCGDKPLIRDLSDRKESYR